MTVRVRSKSKIWCVLKRLARSTGAPVLLLLSSVLGTATSLAAQEIVLYPSDVTTVEGNWAHVASSSGAGSQKMASADYGGSSSDAPAA
ncbi:MAG TPA: hypothetical protein VJ717_10415, partial [Gemmatimonadaceae bacterium]|nr:hypothetical protein [Gemmatimonadaceae bacterium]